MDTIVRAICEKENLPAGPIQVLSGGQVNHVYRVGSEHVLRIGARDDAHQRLKHETELLRSLEGRIPTPRVAAFGQYEGFTYQVQNLVPGQKLYTAWKECSLAEQDQIAAELAASLNRIHAEPAGFFGSAREDTPRFDRWDDCLTHKFNHTLDEIKTLGLRMAPGMVEMAEEYFHAHRHVLQGGFPTLVHGDLSLVNILVDQGHISAILDFEHAVQAPADYELWVLEAFCLYPNDWAEENNEVYCTADYANLIPLLRKHRLALFDTPNLRQRVNLYQIDAALGSYVAWRKDNLDTIPPETMAAKGFYMARISNFIFGHGARLFYA